MIGFMNMKSCYVMNEDKESIKCESKNCKSEVLEKVKVFNLSTTEEYHYTNLTAEDALMSAWLDNNGKSHLLTDSSTRSDLAGKITYGSRSIGLGDFATVCGRK